MKVYDEDGNVIDTAFSNDGTRLEQVFPFSGSPIKFDVFRETAILTALPSISNSGNKQGACTDGTYIYQIIIGTFAFLKYNIQDGTYTSVSGGSSVPYNHGNDMTYNPNNQHIYVAAMSSDGAVMELDTDFNYIRTHYLVRADGTPYPVWGLAFDQNTNHFLSEEGNTTMAVYDQDFNYLYSFTMPDIPSATGQGMETDGEYIYRVWYNPNTIDVSTMDGELVARINNPMSGEPETLMYDWIHGKMYINRNSAAELYWKIQLKKYED